jgi:hypothetical protein
MTNRVRVYKVNEITQEFINSLEFSEPMLDKRSYFINNETEFYIQISVTFYTNFYKYSDHVYCSILCDENTNEMFLNFDNSFVNRIHKMFPLWFNKSIELEHLIEYYVPSVLIEDEASDSEQDSEKLIETKSKNDNNNDNNDNNNDNNNENNNGPMSSSDEELSNSENEECETDNTYVTYVICEIPYEAAENDLDIMIYGSNNELIEDDWSNINLEGKSCKCIVKLKTIKIEDSKFYPIWEIIQIKEN